MGTKGYKTKVPDWYSLLILASYSASLQRVTVQRVHEKCIASILVTVPDGRPLCPTASPHGDAVGLPLVLGSRLCRVPRRHPPMPWPQGCPLGRIVRSVVHRHHHGNMVSRAVFIALALVSVQSRRGVPCRSHASSPPSPPTNTHTFTHTHSQTYTHIHTRRRFFGLLLLLSCHRLPTTCHPAPAWPFLHAGPSAGARLPVCCRPRTPQTHTRLYTRTCSYAHTLDHVPIWPPCYTSSSVRHILPSLPCIHPPLPPMF